MKRIRKLILLGLIGGLLIMSGCIKSSDSVIKESLKNKYGEDFIIHETKTLPGGFDATVSPVSNPEILFVARVKTDGTVAYDNYCEGIVNYQIKERMMKGITFFFPDVYIFVDSKFNLVDKNIDFKKMSIDEIICKMTDSKHADIKIFINNEIGSSRKFEEEYRFFSEELEKEVKNNYFLPFSIEMFMVTPNTKKKVEEYFSKDLDIDDNFITNVIGTTKEEYYETVYLENQTQVGNPPSIFIGFDPQYESFLQDEKEYIRRRELLENVK